MFGAYMQEADIKVL